MYRDNYFVRYILYISRSIYGFVDRLITHCTWGGEVEGGKCSLLNNYDLLTASYYVLCNISNLCRHDCCCYDECRKNSS